MNTITTIFLSLLVQQQLLLRQGRLVGDDNDDDDDDNGDSDDDYDDDYDDGDGRCRW